MIEFQSLTLKAMPFFRDQTFNLARKGVSLILGRNLDSSNHNTNGAGKSLFFSQLPEILIGEPTIGNKKDLIRKGSVEIALKKGKHQYVVNRTFKPGEKITIARDGVDLEYRELSAAKLALKNILPFNAEEVLSLLYLDSRIPHPLVRGSSAVRQKFFMDFFRMNSAPVMRKLVRAELAALESKAGAFAVHRERLGKLSTSLKDVNVDSLKDTQSKVRAKLAKYEALARRFSALGRIKDDYTASKEAYQELKGLSVLTWEDAEAESVAVEGKLSLIAEQLANWKRYEEWVSGKQELVERKKEVKAELSRYPQQSGVTVKQITLDIEASTIELDDAKARVDKIKGRLRDVSEAVESQLRAELVTAKRKRKELEEAVDACPTCGAAYDNKHAKKEIGTVDERITELKASIESTASRREALLSKKESIDSTFPLIEETLSAWGKVRKLKVEQASWEESEAMQEPKVDKDTLGSRRTRLKDKYQTLLGSKPVFAAVTAYKEMSPEDKELLKGDSPTDTLLSLHEKAGGLKMRIEEVEGLQEEYLELTKTVAAMSKELDEKDALDVLHDALSKKGVESLMIKMVCQRLEQQVNKYARLLFPEDFYFHFDLETQFNITVTRKYGKKEITSDVRKLSGAESLLFSLILLIALLAFMPPKNRTNLLILDEPTSTFSPEMIDAFVKFLPILNSVIPHVIVITPTPNNVYAGAKVFTVVKKGGHSRIIEGTDVTSFTKVARKKTDV